MADRKNGKENAATRGGPACARPWLAAAISLFLLLFSSASEAKKPLLEDNFDGRPVSARSRGGNIQQTPFGKGWSSPVPRNPSYDPAASHFVAYDASRLNPDGGSISFRLKRDNKFGSETIFSLVDNTFNGVLSVNVTWESDFAMLGVLADGPVRNVWMMRRSWDEPAFRDHLSPVIRLPEISPGQWVHLAFTWGPAAADHAIYLDGKKLAIEMRGPSDIPLLVRKSSYLMFGAYPKGNGSDVPNTMMTSTLADVRLFDEPLNTFDEKGRQGAVTASLSDDTFKVPGISGKLVAGDTVHVELLASPGGSASFDMGTVKGIAMPEVPPTAGGPGTAPVDNGTYRGSYTIRPGDDYTDGRIVGRFVSADNVAADNVVSDSKWSIDTRPRVAFAIDKTDLSADQKTTSRVKLSVKDANGNPIKGRKLKLTLATTDEYTGLVGSGTARSKDIAAAVKASLAGAEVETRWRGETDGWGEADFDYTSGFAAKTVILQVKDLESGAVAVDYITSYKEASIDIALTPPVSMAAARRGLMYYMKIEATRTELTADGRSRSVIRASVFDPGGKPVPGDAVSFALSSPNGSLRTISGTTDASGVAIAEYTAGKKIGIVVVTATDTVRNVSASVSITLLSDAPAKIHLAAKPASLPANGMSRADINVKVTDINDNPNDNTKVEFKIASGGGTLDYPERVTDKFGETTERYTAGTTPGIARIVATVRSKVPGDAELAKAQNVLYAPWSEEGEDIRISQWLKRKGETALYGETILEYTIGRDGTIHRLKAPYDCRIEFQYVEYWDFAQTGDTLALISPVAAPGSGGEPGGNLPPPPKPSNRRR